MCLYAEEVNYWKTSQSSPDSWLEKAKRQITNIGGVILREGFGSEIAQGKSAYMLSFRLETEVYKIVWPVMTSKTGNERAARIQAATMLYHDVKAKCMSSVVLGVKAAFFTYLCLPDGRTASQASIPELEAGIPAMLQIRNPLLIEGNQKEKFTD